MDYAKSWNELRNVFNEEENKTVENQDEGFLSGLRLVDSDKKVMGFHLTGDVRAALKRLKADDYEMSEVVNEMLRKYLPKKYFRK